MAVSAPRSRRVDEEHVPVNITPEIAPRAPESPEAALRAGVSADEAYRFGRPPTELPFLDPPVPTRVVDTAGVKVEVIDLARSRDRARFVDLPAPIYAGDPHQVAPLRIHLMRFLDPARSPTFANLEVHALIATRDGRDVGRITAHVDRRYDEYHGGRTGFFGWFECVNDRKVAHALLAEATRWLRARGATEVFGPMNFTTNHTAGLLVENFDRPPFVEETYNPRYYEELLTSFGLGKAKDLYAWWIELSQGMDTPGRSRVARVAERVRKREGVTVRPVDLSRAEEEIGKLFTLYNAAWEKNWGFVPLTEPEFAAIAKDIKDLILPELVLFVEVGGKPVGFTATVPNLNDVLPRDGKLFPFGWLGLVGWKKKVRRGRLYTLGMLPEYRKRGLETLMFSETLTAARKLGWTDGEIGWTLEDNELINKAIEMMEGRLDRKYRILGMRLGSAS
jgi:GNAT superfamily N-acetyltransferase